MEQACLREVHIPTLVDTTTSDMKRLRDLAEASINMRSDACTQYAVERRLESGVFKLSFRINSGYAGVDTWYISTVVL
jgi:hypothetical protein